MKTDLRRYFLSGLGVFLPLALTIYLFIWAFNFTDGFFGKFIRPLFPDEFRYYFPGLSILAGILLIILIGFLVTNYVGRRFHLFIEQMLLKVPFFREVYPAFKELTGFFFSEEKKLQFKQVVIVEYPSAGILAMGFLTNDAPQKVCEKMGRPLVNVFIPSVPNPLTGFVVMFPREKITITDIPVDEAIKYFVSGGVVSELQSKHAQ